MTSLRRIGVGVALVLCLVLTSCGDTSGKKVARKFKPGDQLFFDPVVPDETYIKLTGKPFTAWQKDFFHTCTKVTYGMSEQEIDGVMSAYSSHREKRPGEEENGPDGRYLKFYEWTKSAGEYDYFLCVTFDDTHHLVSAEINEWLK